MTNKSHSTYYIIAEDENMYDYTPMSHTRRKTGEGKEEEEKSNLV